MVVGLVATAVLIVLSVTEASGTIDVFGPRHVLLRAGEVQKSTHGALYVLEDKQNTLSIWDVSAESFQSRFVESQRDVPNIGVTSSALWCRMQVENTSGEQWYLKIGNPYLDTVQIFFETKDGFLRKDIGFNYAFAGREIKTTNFIVPVPLEKDSLRNVFIRVKHHILSVPISFGKLEYLLDVENTYNIVYGVYFGLVLCLVAVNLFLIFPLKDWDLLYYVSYIIFFGAYIGIKHGFLPQIVPTSIVSLTQYTPMFGYIAQISLVTFTLRFLKAKEYYKFFYYSFVTMNGCSTLALILFFTKYRHIGSSIVEAVIVTAVIMALIYAIAIYRRGYRAARFYILAFFISETAYLIYALNSFGFIPSSDAVQGVLAAGSAWEMIVLTLAVVDKIYILRNEKVESEKQRAKLIEEQNVVLEKMVVQRTKELEAEKVKSDELLRNILPEHTALELKQHGRTNARTYDSATIMFTDFKNFTLLSEQISAEDLIQEIDHCYTAYDEIVERYGIEKIKTAGDSYLCVSGLPIPNESHAADIVNAGIDIVEFTVQRAKQRTQQGLFSFEIRVGVNTGSVIAGIVGKKKFVYDIWSDAVNVASRMESSGEEGKVNISGATYELIKGQFNCTYRGKVEAKHKGEIDMYFVQRA